MTRLLNAVQFAATSSGTGDFVVSSAIQGFQTPSADGAINGETYSYRAQNSSMSEWEIGIGTWNSGTSTLARTTILASSTGSKVSFTAAPNVGLTPSKSDLLTPNATATITKGYTVTPNNIGTFSSFTIDPALGNYQYGTNNGAFTLTNPASDCAVDLLVTNGASAGSITFSGFTVGSSTGDALTTTNTSKFIVSIRRINSVSTYIIKALQ